jgi:anti-anti-sigma factor
MVGRREGAVATTDGEVTVLVTDRHMHEHVPELRWRLHDAVLDGASHVTVDVSQVRHLSSNALSALLCVHRRCRGRGGYLTVRGGNRSTLDLLYRAGLHRVFVLDGSRRPPHVPGSGPGRETE